MVLVSTLNYNRYNYSTARRRIEVVIQSPQFPQLELNSIKFSSLSKMYVATLTHTF